ncbi:MULTISPECIES: toxin-antitoxin system protein HicB [Acetobacter]|uniref:Putative HicB family RNase H-like nuclease n=1 Tax=Acetobacter lovaniensis TaxID=104100 RepID=A0A841QFU2_9PROT|nr:toxin-antitoxin system protein HicB [Acetobacter lovaniensis]MBB6456922.1 putative HicB family RNase H-like nuclease [Acetobacter lovaniensis]MCI1698760.1 toxin-antitoxin system protein HicB [Acetobacter lovaniensis]MCI1795480.1 toxin-antitoxin system protein HicB [Acetobacter lovaniensis]MCP1240208.1 toxin-antitoxin system protein HicB [Acetobacter lovaniensis]NHN81084.1 toxin-antitoxin system protein HicB [Acetobacter lovaniensis]
MPPSAQDIMLIGGIPALISYQVPHAVFRGVFVGLNAEVDFFASTVAGLEPQGEAALRSFLHLCQSNRRSPLLLSGDAQKTYLLEEIYEQMAEPARQCGIDLYDVVREQVRTFQPGEGKSAPAILLSL